MKNLTLTALVSILVTATPALLWIGSLQEKVRRLESEVRACATKEAQQVQDSWMKSWSDDLNYRLRRLEERR